MKKINYLFQIISIIFLTNNQGYSQNETCEVLYDTTNNSGMISVTPPCGSFNDYIPSQEHPSFTSIKTIRLVLHFINDDDGLGNFNDIQINNPQYNDQSKFWNTILNGLNTAYSDLQEETRQNPDYPSPLLSDSRVRFFVSQDNIFIHSSSQYYNQKNSSVLYNHFVRDNANMTHKEDAIHLFFCPVSDGNVGGRAAFLGNRIISYNIFNKFFVGFGQNPPHWLVKNHIAHEIGHILGLNHTNRFGYGPCALDGDNLEDTPPGGPLNPCPCWNFNGPDGLPCSNNMMTYNASQNALTRQQVGTINYTLITNSASRKFVIEDFCEYDMNESVTISSGSTEVWNNTRFFAGDIIIEENASLTITCLISLPLNAKVVVKKGGRLIIDGGTITNTCGNQWRGIFVEGDRDLPQIPYSNQGLLIIKNQGVIEHARTGVSFIGLNSNGQLNWAKTGGVIKAVDAIFRNNNKDVGFYFYTHTYPNATRPAPNFSKFENCKFLTTNDYRSDFVTDINANISMWGVAQVKFHGCQWEDKRDGSIDSRMNDVYNRRDGLVTSLATYRITNLFAQFPLSHPSPTLANSSFKNMKYAIRSYEFPLAINNPIASNPSAIQDVAFENCLGGIYHSGVQTATIIRNTFEIEPYMAPINRDIEAYGIYLDNCNVYHIEGNYFSSNWDNAPIGQVGVGLVVNENKNILNTIYRNYFDDNLLGTQAIGHNKHTLSGHDYIGIGLQYECNNFGNTSDNNLDIWAIPHQTIQHSSSEIGLPQ